MKFGEIVKSSLVRGVAVIGFAALIVGLSAAPANAVSTPTPGALTSGSSLSAIDCDEGPIGQLYSVDVSNADGTAIGTGSNVNGSDCGGGAAWDYATNTMYYVAYPAGPGATYLASVNLTSGASTAVGAFQAAGTDENIDAIAIGVNGSGYAIDELGELYSLNLSSGALTAIAATGGDTLYGFAADPVTGVYYVLDYVTGVYSTINMTTGVLTAAGALSFTPRTGPEALQIDVNGTFWVENDGTDADIWSFDPAHPSAAVESGVFTVGGTQTYVETLMLKPGSIAPVITSSAPPASVPQSTAFSYQITANGAGPITFSITAGTLPTGLSLDPATGLISGTPTTPGSYAYTVTATNTAGTATTAITQVVAAAIHLPIVSG